MRRIWCLDDSDGSSAGAECSDAGLVCEEAMAMSSLTRADYVRLYTIACDLHSTRNVGVRESAAEIMDMVEKVLGQMYQPKGMRKVQRPGDNAAAGLDSEDAGRFS